MADCHLCNHPFWNLYEIKESGDEEKELFAAVTRKHQIEADRVIRGIEVWQQSQCCRMPSCLLLCMCVWHALPRSWAPFYHVGRPRSPAERVDS